MIMKNINQKIVRWMPVAGVAACLVPTVGEAQEKPNVVIILADDMGYGDVSSFNPLARTQTPYIDRLASQGLNFRDAHAGGAVSIPSRYGLLTGRYFFRAPAKDSYWGYLPPLIDNGRETIGSVMQKAGYTTACVGKWHLGVEWQRKDPSQPQILNRQTLGYTNTDFSKPVLNGPNEMGFDYSFILPASLDMPPYAFLRNGQAIDPDIVLTADLYPTALDRTVYAWDRKHARNEEDIYWDRGVWWRNGEMSRSFKVEDCLDHIVNEGISFIENHVAGQPDKPFMLYLPLTGPHTPWMPNDDFKGTSAMGTYGDFIGQIDDVVARVNRVLSRLGIEENTIVIFASDNGSAWEEEDTQLYGHASSGPWRGQKGDAWEGGHRVPFIVKWPAQIRGGQTYDHTVSLIDLLATFADMNHIPLNDQDAEDSFSLYPVLTGQQKEAVRDHLIYISSSGNLAITSGDWKYIDCLGSGGFTYPSVITPVPGGPSGQLYHLTTDPGEQSNLYFQESGRVKELSGLLRKIVQQEHSRR